MGSAATSETPSGPRHGSLCDYCAEIDFEILRNPTMGDLRLLNAGGEPKNQYPFKREPPEVTYIQQNLGLHSRIEESAASCVFCRAIVQVHKQQPHVLDFMRAAGVPDPLCIATIGAAGRLLAPEGVKWEGLKTEESDYYVLRRLSLGFRPLEPAEAVQPGALLNKDSSVWQRLTGCFQSYEKEDMAERGWSAPEGHDQLNFGGRRRPAMLDTKLAALWLHDCFTNHGGACGVTLLNDTESDETLTDMIPTPLFRLIDGKDRAIVDLPDIHLSQLKYVALSYVWGGPQRITLQTSNYADLHTPGSLTGRLAKTIDDALTLAEALGVRYVWVDALCIIQDSEEDKAAQLSGMGKVYANSLFTIVAASGADSEAGLPGISAPRTGVQHEVLLPQQPPLSLLSTLNPGSRSFENGTNNTVWASRGWTLQERALTRRALIVLKEQMLWSCGRSYWSEEMCCEAPAARASWFTLHDSEHFLTAAYRNWYTPDDESAQVWYRLQLLVVDYTGRRLTVEGDALDAFSSILQQVRQREGEDFLWGIPATRFELGLCWEGYRGLRRRTCLSTLKMTTLRRRVPFPSWSWIGWEGVIGLRVEDRYVELGLDPVILCYVLRQSPLRLVRLSRLAMDTPQGRARLLPPAFHALAKSPLAVTIEDIQEHYPDMTRDILADTPDDQLLFFWANVARFTVSEPVDMTPPSAVKTPLEDPQERYRRRILDGNGNVVGLTAVCKLVSDDEESESGECEFLLLATNEPPENEKQKIVMQIRRRGGIAYRVNIADVRADAWEAANAVRTLVALW